MVLLSSFNVSVCSCVSTYQKLVQESCFVLWPPHWTIISIFEYFGNACLSFSLRQHSAGTCGVTACVIQARLSSTILVYFFSFFEWCGRHGQCASIESHVIVWYRTVCRLCRAILCISAAIAVMRCLSIRPSVCLSVRHVRGSCQNE